LISGSEVARVVGVDVVLGDARVCYGGRIGLIPHPV